MLERDVAPADDRAAVPRHAAFAALFLGATLVNLFRLDASILPAASASAEIAVGLPSTDFGVLGSE
ncbi:hypothetical protein GCM10027073_56890 [Streptomyces chlorus]